MTTYIWNTTSVCQQTRQEFPTQPGIPTNVPTQPTGVPTGLPTCIPTQPSTGIPTNRPSSPASIPTSIPSYPPLQTRIQCAPYSAHSHCVQMNVWWSRHVKLSVGYLSRLHDSHGVEVAENDDYCDACSGLQDDSISNMFSVKFLLLHKVVLLIQPHR